MNIKSKLRNLMLLAAASASLVSAHAQSQYILDDYNANQNLPFATAESGGTATVSSGQLAVTSGTGGFVEYLGSAFLGQSGTAINALLSGTNITITLRALGDQPQDFEVRLAVSTSAWLNGGGNYQAQPTTVSIAAGQTGTVTLSVPLTTDILTALTNFSNVGGYFQFILDNNGYPALNNPVQFNVTKVSVQGPPPSPVALGTQYTLDDYEFNRPLFCNIPVGGSAVTITNDRLQVITGTTANFEQILEATSFYYTEPSLDTLDAVLAGGSINFQIESKSNEVTSGFNVRLAFNSDAWTDGGGNYRATGSQVFIPAGQNTSQTLTYNYDSTSDFWQALNSFQYGGGTYFNLYLDNSGSPGISTPQPFYISGVTVGPPLAAPSVLDDFNANQNFASFGAAGSASGSIVNNQFQIMSGTGGFAQYALAGVNRGGPAINDLLGGQELDYNLQALGGQPQDFSVRLVLNTDALPGVGAYESLAGVYVTAGQTGAVTLAYAYGAGGDLARALAAWQAGNGTYFQLFLDNGGYPNLNSSISFDVGSVIVLPAPTPLAVPSVKLSFNTSSNAWQVNWLPDSAAPLYHLFSAANLNGSWAPANQTYYTNAPVSTSLVPLGSPSSTKGFFRLLKY